MAAREIAAKKYIVKLSEAERNHLLALINKGKSPAKRLLKARILLKADAGAQGENWSDGEIIEALDTNKSMVTSVRQQLVEEGLEAVLSRKERTTPAITPIFDGEKEARGAGLLDASRRPCALDAAASRRQGGGTWHRRARQRQHDRARSEKNTLQPHRKKQWVIPPEVNGAFVAALSREVAAWQASRNKNQTKADWRFTTADARIKLKRLYPRFD